MAASPTQRGVCARPPVLIGAILVMVFVCAVLMKISAERGKQVAELDAMLIESQQTIDNTNRERDLAHLARKETETELDKIKNSKKGLENEKNKISEELNHVKEELQTCSEEVTSARAEKEQSQQSLQTEKDSMNRKIDELTQQNNQLTSENEELRQELEKAKAAANTKDTAADEKTVIATGTDTTEAPNTDTTSNTEAVRRK